MAVIACFFTRATSQWLAPGMPTGLPCDRVPVKSPQVAQIAQLTPSSPWLNTTKTDRFQLWLQEQEKPCPCSNPAHAQGKTRPVSRALTLVEGNGLIVQIVSPPPRK